MAGRGSYAKGIAKRAEILDVALEVVARSGFSNATVKELAEAVGLSQNGLLHYFGSKDELFMEVLRHRDELLTIQLGTDPKELAEEFGDRVVRAVQATASAPGLLQLTIRLTVEGAEPQHPHHDFLASRLRASQEITQQALQLLQDAGHVSSEMDTGVVAHLVLAAIDGLQVQWMYDQSVDLAAHVVHLLSALGVPVTAASAEQPEAPAPGPSPTRAEPGVQRTAS